MAGYHPDGSRAGAAGRLVLGLVFLAATVLVASLVLPDLGPNLRAARGDGRPGVFTAERLDCAKRCLWYGTFRPDAGSGSRADVWLEGARHGDVGTGAAVPAVDTGASRYVFSAGGSPHWAGMIGGSALTVVFAAGSLHLVVRGLRGLVRRRG
ncbi:hypothetical protein [Actinoallomurus rhizosphaericola]|uniref:hypothetical protein n=1 Tax=Actinoallomurus rhizosphaericola TaxID=2952536 RepID=UPI002091E5E5|nr:hypothetical protein [Actinoallomurus rhizosphaericola]MCO5996371.1 hypothetical protein [Actinoallomurus rhizosphaericola]